MIILKGIKLLLIAIGVLALVSLGVIFIAMVYSNPAGAVVLAIPISLVVVIGALIWGMVADADRRRRATSMMNYLEQAVRLNLPLPRIVKAIGESETGQFARDMDVARQRLEEGASLVTVLEMMPQMPPRVIGLVAAAERHGRLPQVLARLMEQRRAAIARGMGFLPFYRVYPLVLGLAFIGVTSMLMVFVIPKFEQVFKDFKTDLPGITKVTIAISRSAGPWIALLLAVVLIALIVQALISRLRGTQYGLIEGPGARIADRLPWIGRVRAQRALGDVLECAADAIESGRPIETSLFEAGQVCGNAPMRLKVDRWAELMTGGESIAQAARIAGMPAMVSGMLATATQTPDLAQVMRFLGRYYTTRFSRSVALLQASVAPVAAIVMGFLVCWLALSIFGALISLIQTVSSPAPRGL